MVKDIRRKEAVKPCGSVHTKHLRLFLLLQMLIRVALLQDSRPLFLCRGVSINVLRHEAEFYGITPLGMCSNIPIVVDPSCTTLPSTVCLRPRLEWARSVWVFMARKCYQRANLNMLLFPLSSLTGESDSGELLCLRASDRCALTFSEEAPAV